MKMMSFQTRDLLTTVLPAIKPIAGACTAERLDRGPLKDLETVIRLDDLMPNPCTHSPDPGTLEYEAIDSLDIESHRQELARELETLTAD